MAGKPKSLALLAMMRPSKRGPMAGPPGEEGELPGGTIESAMEDFLAAVEAKDTTAMADAFRAAADYASEPPPDEAP
jgi:hypothetical protein